MLDFSKGPNFPELKELVITKEAAAELRKGNVLRIVVARISDKILEVVISPTWEHSEPTERQPGGPLYEVSEAIWSVYSANSDEPLWRGSKFPISLPDPDKL